MKTKDYSHLIGKTANYRRSYMDKEPLEGVIAKITPSYFLNKTEYTVTMQDGSEVDITQIYFSEPIF